MFRQSMFKAVLRQTAVATAIIVGAVALTPAHAAGPDGRGKSSAAAKSSAERQAQQSRDNNLNAGASARPHPGRVQPGSPHPATTNDMGIQGGVHGEHRSSVGQESQKGTNRGNRGPFGALDPMQPMVFAVLDAAGEVMIELFGVSSAHAERGAKDEHGSRQGGRVGNNSRAERARQLGNWGGAAGFIAGAPAGPWGAIGGAAVGRVVGYAVGYNSGSGSNRPGTTGRNNTNFGH